MSLQVWRAVTVQITAEAPPVRPIYGFLPEAAAVLRGVAGFLRALPLTQEALEASR